jgi:hypothetical protein
MAKVKGPSSGGIVSAPAVSAENFAVQLTSFHQFIRVVSELSTTFAGPLRGFVEGLP